MLESLIELDKEVFFFLNGLHTPVLDQVMYWISDKLVWIPLYAGILYLLIRNYGWKALIWLVGIALAIAATDQLLSGFMKPFFERYRPSRDPEMEGLVHIVNGYTGGRYGFASSHAGNVFAISTFLFLLLKKQYPWIRWMFLWAAVVSYSRVYLGVHYPGDILTGAIIGTFFGFVFYKLSLKVFQKYQNH